MQKEIARKMEEYGHGYFSKIDGIVFGFNLTRGKCEMFENAAVDEFRHEEFTDALSALRGFVVDGKPIGDYEPAVFPCVTI